MQQVSGLEFLLMAEICCQITIYFRAVNIFQICSFVIILKTQCASYSRIRVFFNPYFPVFFQSLLFQTFTKMTQKRYNNCTFNIFLFFFSFFFFFSLLTFTLIGHISNVQKIKFSIKGFFSKCDQMPSFRQIWSYLLKNIY